MYYAEVVLIDILLVQLDKGEVCARKMKDGSNDTSKVGDPKKMKLSFLKSFRLHEPSSGHSIKGLDLFNH